LPNGFAFQVCRDGLESWAIIEVEGVFERPFGGTIALAYELQHGDGGDQAGGNQPFESSPRVTGGTCPIHSRRSIRPEPGGMSMQRTVGVGDRQHPSRLGLVGVQHVRDFQLVRLCRLGHDVPWVKA
jgi:hypothetical protein